MKKIFSIIAILVILVSFASCGKEGKEDTAIKISVSQYNKIIDATENHVITEKEEKLEEIITEFCVEELNEKINFSKFYYTEDKLEVAEFVYETVDDKHFLIPVDEKVIINHVWCTDWTKLELRDGKIALKFSNWETKEISEKDAIYLKQYSVIEDTEFMPELFENEETKVKYELYFKNREKVSKNIDFDSLIWYMDEYHYIYRKGDTWFTL